MTQSNTIQAIVGILKKEDKVLVAKRPSGKPYSGYWEFPGGKIEDNEVSKDALIRELYEELGIKVITAQPLFKHTHAYPDKIVLLDLWWVTEFSGYPYSKENQMLRWVTYAEMLDLHLLEANRSIIDKVFQISKLC